MGNFNTATNWSPNGAPTASDTLIFRNVSWSPTVNFPGKINFPLPVYEMYQLHVGSINATFADSLGIGQAPGTVNVTNPSLGAGRGIIIGLSDTDTFATLTTTLDHLNAAAVTVGDAPGSIATLNVNGGALTVTGSSSTDDELIVGHQGNGALRVANGGRVDVSGEHGNMVVGKYSDSSVTVEGPGSQLSAAGITLGNPQNFGVIEILDGGRVSSGAVGMFSPLGFFGSASVRGAGSAWEMESLYAGGIGVSEGATFSVAQETILPGGAELWIGAGCTATLGSVESAGTLTAKGDVTTMGRFENHGVVVVESTGSLQIDGDYIQPIGYGKLSLEIGAVDNPLVATTAHIEGLVEVKFQDGYSPIVGDAFDLFDASISGQFGTPGLPLLGAGMAWDYSQLYTTGVIRIRSTLYTADFDEDGDVDADDLEAWTTGFGAASGAIHTQGDANSDGAVDGADFLLWQQQFGSGAASVAAGEFVPEPASVVLLSLAIVTRRRRRERPAWSVRRGPISP